MSSRVVWNRSMQMLDRMPFSLCPCVLWHIASTPLHCISSFFSRKGLQLTCMKHTYKKTELHAVHEIYELLLVCFLLSCSKRIMDQMQCMKYVYVARGLLTCSPLHITCMFWLSHSTKIEEHTSVQQTQVSI